MRPTRSVATVVLVTIVIALMATACTRPRVRGSSASSTTTTVVVGNDEGPLGEPRGIVDLTAGTCFNDVGDPTRKPLVVRVVECDQAHTYETYDVIAYAPADGSGDRSRPYPGKDRMRLAAEDLCYTKFEAWMGIEWKRSDYDIATWWPSKDSWPFSDRTVLCAVYRAVGGKTVGSVQGSGI